MDATKNYFSIKQIVLCALFFGVVGASFLIARNCRTVSKPKTGTKVIIYSIFYTILLILLSNLAWSGWGEILLVGGVATAINCIAAWLMSEVLYGKELEMHTDSGGSIYSPWHAVALAAISLAITIPIVLGNFMWLGH